MTPYFVILAKSAFATHHAMMRSRHEICIRLCWNALTNLLLNWAVLEKDILDRGILITFE